MWTLSTNKIYLFSAFNEPYVTYMFESVHDSIPRDIEWEAKKKQKGDMAKNVIYY